MSTRAHHLRRAAWAFAASLVLLVQGCTPTRHAAAPRSRATIVYSDKEAPAGAASAAGSGQVTAPGNAARAAKVELPAQPVRPPHPLVNLGDKELEAMLVNDPAKLGPISLGRTNAGALFNAVPMPKGAQWKIVNPPQTWATAETVAALVRAIGRVNETFRDTLRIHIGDISERSGGHIAPHLSHQSGRDVDMGYYYTTPLAWYTHARASNLDLPRTWALVKAFVIETDVERIFIDRSIQKLLKAYALTAGEDPTWLDRVFGGPLSRERPLIAHSPGHASHLHARFYNPIAQETGRRVYRMLVAHKKISPPTYFIHHKVRRGDTLGRMARKYRTTVKALKKANRLRSTRIIAGRKYKIPRRGGVAAAGAPLVIPPRRLPPSGAARSTRAPAAKR